MLRKGEYVRLNIYEKKKYAYSESDLVLQDDGKRNLDES